MIQKIRLLIRYRKPIINEIMQWIDLDYVQSISPEEIMKTEKEGGSRK